METPPETKTIEVDKKTLNNLNITRKWTMFLAIIGFIFLGIIIVIGAMAGTFLSSFKSAETTSEVTEYVIFAAVLLLATAYFFSVLFLYRFSKHAAKTLQTYNIQELYRAFKNLKFYFVSFGIVVIIALTLYFVALIVPGISMPFLKGL